MKINNMKLVSLRYDPHHHLIIFIRLASDANFKKKFDQDRCILFGQARLISSVADRV